MDAAGACPGAATRRRGATVLRVLHVDGATEWRGGQRQLQLLCEGLARRGVPQAVMCPRAGALWARLPGVRRLPSAHGARSLEQAVRAGPFDVVALHDRRALQWVPRRGLSAPVVLHRRVDFAPSRPSWRRYRRVQRVVAVSRAVERVMRRVLAGRAVVDVVWDGVEPPVPVVAEAVRPPTLLSVGALVPHKGHRTLLDALVELENVSLVVAGEGPLRRRLERHAARVGVHERVRFVGHRADLVELRRDASLLVHPSHQEGLGQAVLEALLAGLPVVASSVGGLAEVLRGRAVLVPPRRAARLARGIRQALRGQAAARRRLAHDRAELVARFGVDRMVDETLRVYQAAVAAPRREIATRA